MYGDQISGEVNLNGKFYGEYEVDDDDIIHMSDGESFDRQDNDAWKRWARKAGRGKISEKSNYGSKFNNSVEDFDDDLDELHNEIDAEETMSEEETADLDAEIDVADDMGDNMMDMGDMEDAGKEVEDHGDFDSSAIEDTMGDLEDALAALKAEFEKLESGEEAAGEEAGEEEEVADEKSDEEEEEMDESWLAEFNDLDESISLEKVAVSHGEGEVGSGHYAPVETNKKSPIAKAPDAVMGAKPVKTGEGPVKSGFNRETAPATKGKLPHTEDNRRKKATDKMSKVSKEGDSAAKLNKTKSEFGADTNKMSPLSKSPRK